MRGLSFIAAASTVYASAFGVGPLGTNPHSCNQTWTAVILNSSETTSGPVGHLKCTIAVYIQSFGGQKGGSSEPPRTPPAYGPAGDCCSTCRLALETISGCFNLQIYFSWDGGGGAGTLVQLPYASSATPKMKLLPTPMLEHLRQVFCRLHQAGLRLKAQKCLFLREVPYFGHVVTKNGIKPGPSKTEKMKNYPVSGALRHDYCTQNCEAVYITLDSYYDLDTWREITCHQTLSNYDIILDMPTSFS